MSKKRHASDLTGKGSEISGGRWNEKNLPALYLAENISLSIIETIVHCQKLSDLYNRMILYIEIPENSIDNNFNKLNLPKDWNSTPWNRFTINYGTQWLQNNQFLAIKLPSAIVPEESIYLINPKHDKHNEIKIKKTTLFQPDNRLKLN